MPNQRNTPRDQSGITNRDLRLDCVRGAAILIVLVDHIEFHLRVSLVNSWTPISLGFSDVSEIFVFVSGCTFGLVYSRVADKHGWVFAEKKALKRTFQIYLVYVLAMWLILLETAIQGSQVAGSLSNATVWEAFVYTPSLCYHLFGCEILALYIILLPFMLLLLRTYSRCAPLAWIVSFGLYLLVLTFPAIQIPRVPGPGAWYFNPFSWQFLFFLGMTWGAANRQTSRADPPPNLLLLVGAVAILAIGLWRMKLYPAYGIPVSFDTPAVRAVLESLTPTLHKTRLGPLRLLHFFAFAYVFRALFRRHSALWNSVALHPIIVCGQHALFVYAAGLIFVHNSPFLLSLIGGTDPLSVLLLDLDACIMTVGLAYILHAARSRRTVRSPESLPAPESGARTH